jgi:hypothetical protein
LALEARSLVGQVHDLRRAVRFVDGTAAGLHLDKVVVAQAQWRDQRMIEVNYEVHKVASATCIVLILIERVKRRGG